jgi:hypothetical protein
MNRPLYRLALCVFIAFSAVFLVLLVYTFSLIAPWGFGPGALIEFFSYPLIEFLIVIIVLSGIILAIARSKRHNLTPSE